MRRVLATLLLVPVLVVPVYRLGERPRAEFAVTLDRLDRWGNLTRQTPEHLERGVAHRYELLAPDLEGAARVGYFAERDQSRLWADSATPAGHDRIERYYMAQAILAPTLLRFDELHALIVIDCGTAEEAEEILRRENLVAVRRYGVGLVLARPES